MKLTDDTWEDLEGGYKVPCDASISLKQLEQTNDPDSPKKIRMELWNELELQGDFGPASYLAVPKLKRIGKFKKLFDWNLLAEN